VREERGKRLLRILIGVVGNTICSSVGWIFRGSLEYDKGVANPSAGFLKL